MNSTQALSLGRHAERVSSALQRLGDQHLLERLWNRDAGLWSADAKTQAAIQNRLGWLEMPRRMAPKSEALRRLAQELSNAGFTHALLLGMGGSGLFSEVCRNVFGVKAGRLDLAVLDTTDPTAVLAHQRRCPLQQLALIISSKSGATSEISALSRYFYEAFKSAGGRPGDHCLVITDAGTPLEAQAKTWGCRHVYALGPETGADVGGRFSALTYFGLVPAALIGVEPETLLARAREMLERCGPRVDLDDNPAAQLGALLAQLAQDGQDKLSLLCSPALASFGAWVEQLVAESTGKVGRGIIPIDAEPLREASAYAEDRIFVELQLASEADEALSRQAAALSKAGHPVIRIQWQDRYDLGGEAMKWSLATTIAGSLMGVNPFDEPNVQESKDRTKTLLSQYAREGRLPSETPLLSDGDVTVYGASTAGGAGSLRQCLVEFFQQARPKDYAAILSFLPRTAALDQAVQTMRSRLAAGLGRATMVGIGPRYLHSTGQLYKGGPNTGLFLLLSADERMDLPIPGEPFTFGVLKQAQALGDFQAMQQKGRRTLRIHLRGDIEPAAKHLLKTIEEVTISQKSKVKI